MALEFSGVERERELAQVKFIKNCIPPPIRARDNGSMRNNMLEGPADQMKELVNWMMLAELEID